MLWKLYLARFSLRGCSRESKQYNVFVLMRIMLTVVMVMTMMMEKAISCRYYCLGCFVIVVGSPYFFALPG